MLLAFEGLLAGAAHVFSGPDHLLGVAPLAADRGARERGWLMGATWGLGHGCGVALLGALGQTLLSAADVEVASAWSERLVGVVLVGLGLVTLRRARGLAARAAGPVPGHPASHHDPAAPVHGARRAVFGVGVVHGLAGAGHLWAVLPSLVMTRAHAAIYVGAYLAASVLAMALFSATLGRLVRSLGTRWVPGFFAGVGALTVLGGVVWSVRAWS